MAVQQLRTVDLVETTEPAWDPVLTALPAALLVFRPDGVCVSATGRLAKDFPAVAGIARRPVTEAWSEYPELLTASRDAARGRSSTAALNLGELVFECRFSPGPEAGGFVTLIIDATERRRLLNDLAQAQKMDSLGMMAGSVAHDFNNLLTAILGFAGILKLSPALDTEDREHLFLIEQSARRGADIAGRLLAFSRGGLARFVAVDVCEVVRETLSLAAPKLHSGIRVATSLPDHSVCIEGDFGQLQQALLNVLSNARDAMTAGGTISVSVAQSERRVSITIEDNGPGMPEAVRARIFEPFFTTKPNGSGTGLGLAITYGIVQGHHGELAVQSAPGWGTTFALSFPRLGGFGLERPEAEAGEGDLVLVVDDDDAVRRTTAETLGALGYNVAQVSSGAVAVELVESRPERFAAVLLDLVMPGMAGRDVFHALQPIRPDLPIIVCTGYAAEAHIDDEMKRSVAGLLQKPFSAERLEEVLRSVGAEPVRPRLLAHH